MGLDDFRTDSEDDDSNEESKEDEEEETTSEETSGLESFRTNNTDGGNNGETQEDNSDNKILGIDPRKYDEMDKEQRIKAVRNNGFPDYRPDYNPDDRWSYNKVVEVNCVCGNEFTFLTKGLCFECGREYQKVMRTVKLTKDPHGSEENNEH